MRRGASRFAPEATHVLRGWYGFLVDRWDAIRGSYWFLPGLLTVGSGVAALALIEFDRRSPSDYFAETSWLGGVSAEAARSLLSTIAGAMMTVTGVVFSITIVALTLTSTQFGPRLLRTFFRDRGSQLVLGAFLATFVFNLLVLRAVEDVDRVPSLATTTAVMLALVSLFVLIYFIHHSATAIQASSVIAAVAREIEQQLPALFPDQIGEPHDETDDADRARLARLESGGHGVRATREGYLRVIDDDTLLGLAREHDLLLRLRVRPGGFVHGGALLAQVHDGALDDETRSALAACFLVGDQRTPVQDLGFLTGQLSEMAVRALSTGVNDPGTAVACIHRLGGALARIADRRLPTGLRADADGRLRIVADATGFEAIAADCFDSIRRYGAHDAQVAVALLDAVVTASANRAEDRRRVLEEHAHEIQRAFDESETGSKRDRRLVDAAFQRALAALAPTAGEPALEVEV